MGNPKPYQNPSSKSKRRQGSSIPKPNKIKRDQRDHIASEVNASVDAASSSAISSSSEQRRFFLNEFQFAISCQLSSIEHESIGDTSFVQLPNFPSTPTKPDTPSLERLTKHVFGNNWKLELCHGKLIEGEIEAGSPAVLMISTSAIRSIELLRGVRSMTDECHGAKLFSKHMKLEEQVVALKERVNFASGTPSRLKKLIDVEALHLTQIKLMVLDINPDVKGYNLFTLPQVSDEFWDLYNTYFHQKLLTGEISICLFGQVPEENVRRGKRKKL